ncbi:MAG TPA: hypothetical protein DF774_02285 [Rheinheimera sp.]|uniref:hypothetical protein n=1 Tax=Rheinheimera sp. TaxID=1869214 RepID=UPI000EBC9427|nr:hypothetical protein [Rheinheimera sp.]HCU64569.1 hypothetical protein [Rheinheimera sp.]
MANQNSECKDDLLSDPALKNHSNELSFHLATAENELIASARLLSAESQLLQSINGVIAGIKAIREVV